MPRRPPRVLFILRWSLLVLCVAISMVGAVSFRWGYELSVFSEHGEGPIGTAAVRGVEVARGGLMLWSSVFRETQLFGTGAVRRRLTQHPSYAGYPSWGRRWGYELHYRRTEKVRVFILITPLYVPLALAAVPTFLLFRAHRRRKVRERRGHCHSCGYDLTANASGRCPECGAEVPAVAAEPRA